MKRSLSAERLYSLAEYQNIKFVNTISEIPEELSRNENIVSKLFLLQSISCDMAYADYKRLREKMKEERVTDVLEFLKEERIQTLKELMIEIEKELDVNKKPLVVPSKES